ncbi:hypothetical protein SAMN05443549_102365 [Flavobacterium fluvii]|uniref:Uncharacterized protein n=1 Tax=Flavobacterium fluvii TaxID=468056 RepID=A0A1M5HT12_9FLAO|nr:hypothetical protein SAMN05443549_102365 [Flavobacterium fluvii]
MKNICLKYILQLTFLLGTSFLWAQQNRVSATTKQNSNYDYHEAFAPFFLF